MFVNNQNKIRLNRAMALSGIASRRKADELIKAGKVRVNNKVVFDLSLKVNQFDKIEADGKILKQENKRYLLFYKPCGYITTTKDEHARKTIYDLLPASFKNLKPVGRLDRDTEGLLLLSNDGDFINQILHPRNKIKKSYSIVLDKALSPEEVNFVKSKLSSGVVLDERLCRLDLVEGKQTKFEAVMHEGINRQIRRMFQVLGHLVVRLKRTKIGPFRLSNLRKGKYLELSKEEAYAALFQAN